VDRSLPLSSSDLTRPQAASPAQGLIQLHPSLPAMRPCSGAATLAPPTYAALSASPPLPCTPPALCMQISLIVSFTMRPYANIKAPQRLRNAGID